MSVRCGCTSSWNRRCAGPGGADLVEHARAEARWYADLYHPLALDAGADSGLGGDGGETFRDGDAAGAAVDLAHETLDRLHVRLDVLTRRLERARGDVAESG